MSNTSSDDSEPLCLDDDMKAIIEDYSSDTKISDISRTPDKSMIRHREYFRPPYNRTSFEKKKMFIKCYEEGKSVVEAAQIVGINKNTASSILNRYKKDGCLIVKRNYGGVKNCKISAEILSEIEEIIERNPSITLKNISKKILDSRNLELCTTSIKNALSKLKVTRKSAPMESDYVNSLEIIEQRKEYAYKFLQNVPEVTKRIVFIGECCFHNHLLTKKLKKNTPPNAKIKAVKYRNVSLIAAMNVEGILHKKVISNLFVNGNIFLDFLDELFTKLAGANITNALLILDNAEIHNTKEVRDKIKKTKHIVMYISPYSAMLNPLEKVFCETKLCARNLLTVPGNNDNLMKVIESSIETITEVDCKNYCEDMSMKMPLAIAGEPLY